MRVLHVGDATEIGKVARQSTEDNLEPTPLNIQLTKLANLYKRIVYIDFFPDSRQNKQDNDTEQKNIRYQGRVSAHIFPRNT